MYVYIYKLAEMLCPLHLRDVKGFWKASYLLCPSLKEKLLRKMHPPFLTENKKYQKSKNCPKWELCEELNLLWKPCQQLELPKSSLSCVPDTGRNLCNNGQLRRDVHSYPRILIHWGMVIQPISVTHNFVIKCFISQTVHGTQGYTILDQLRITYTHQQSHHSITSHPRACASWAVFPWCGCCCPCHPAQGEH